MRRVLLLLLLFLLPVTVYGQTKTKLSGWVQQGNQSVSVAGSSSTAKFQRSFPGATVTVFNRGTSTLSTIYADSSGTAKANPFTADSTGQWSFYGTASTHYDVQFSATGLTTYTIGDLVAPASGGISTLLNVKTDYGAKGDGKVSVSGGSMTNGSATLTCSDCAFTSTAVDAGKLVDVEGAGASGKNLATTISTITNSTTAILAVTASTTISSKHVVYGTNDRAAIQVALTAGTNVYAPKGKYIVGTPGLNISAEGTLLWGDGMFSSELYQIGAVKLVGSTYFDTVNLLAGKFTVRNIGFVGITWNVSGWFALGPSNDGLGDSGNLVSDVLIDGCRFDNLGIGCHSEGAGARWKISNSQANGCWADGWNPNVTDLQMVNCTGTDNGTGGIECSGTNVSIIGGTYSRNHIVGIAIGGQVGCLTQACAGRMNSIIGATLERNYVGIVVSSSNQMTVVIGCTIRQSDTIGIQLNNSGESISTTYANRYNLISNNVISSNGCNIAANCITGTLPSSAGNGILSGTNLNLIQGNYIFDEGLTGFSQTFGIQVSSGVDRNKVIHNQVSGSANQDYLFNGATNLLFVPLNTDYTIQAIGATITYISPTVSHLTGGGIAAPTITGGAGAGASPTITVTGTDLAGQISLTAGAGSVFAGAIFTLTYNVVYATNPFVVLYPANSNAGATSTYMFISSTVGFTPALTTGTLTNGQNYKWNYIVIQ